MMGSNPQDPTTTHVATTHYNVPFSVRDSQHVFVRAKLETGNIGPQAMRHEGLLDIDILGASAVDERLGKDVADGSQTDGEFVPLREAEMRRRRRGADAPHFLHHPQIPKTDDAIDAAGGQVIAARRHGNRLDGGSTRQQRSEILGRVGRPEAHRTFGKKTRKTVEN